MPEVVRRRSAHAHGGLGPNWSLPRWPIVLGGLALVLLIVVMTTAFGTGTDENHERTGTSGGDSTTTTSSTSTTKAAENTTTSASGGGTAGTDGAGGGGTAGAGPTGATAATATTAAPVAAPPPKRSPQPFAVSATAAADQLSTGGSCAPATTRVTARTSGPSAAYLTLRWTAPDGSLGSQSMSHRSDGTWQATLGPFDQAGDATWWVAATSNEGDLKRTDDRRFTITAC